MQYLASMIFKISMLQHYEGTFDILNKVVIMRQYVMMLKQDMWHISTVRYAMKLTAQAKKLFFQ